MRFSSASAGLLFAACALAPSLGAQAGLREGVRVRISAVGATRVTGVVESVTTDSLVIFAEPGATRFAISRAAISKLQVSHGKSAAAGAKKGALWGVGTFGVLGLVGVAVIGGGEEEDAPSTGVLAAAVIAETAAVGALIGAFVKAERWETVSVQPTIGFGRTGLRLGMSLR